MIPLKTCENQIDLCLIIDSSGSIRDNNPRDGSHDNWELQLTFLSDLIKSFDIGRDATRVGAIVFSEQVDLVFPLNGYDNMNDVQERIESIAYLGQTTNTPEALVQTRLRCFSAANGDRPDISNLAVMVTDGVPFPPNRRDPAIAEAKALRDSGVKMVAIGITNVIDKDFLKEMSSAPQIEGQNFFTAVDFQELGAIVDTVVEGTCKAVEGNP